MHNSDPRRRHRVAILSGLIFIGILTLNNQAADTTHHDAKDSSAHKASWADSMATLRAKHLSSFPKGTEPSVPGFQPYNSGPISGKSAAQRVIINVTGQKVLRLLTTLDKSPANCNIWGEPKLIAKDGTETKLTDLKPSRITVGWGKLLLNTNWQGHPLRIGDQTFAYGLWVHANSELQYDLEGKYERFETFIGEDKERADGMVQFTVLGDEARAPEFWNTLAREYPVQSSWLKEAVRADGIQTWVARRETAVFEQDLIRTALKQLSPSDPPYRKELDTLTQTGTPPGSPRWLELFAQICRYRECAMLLHSLNTEGAHATLEKELDTLAMDHAVEADPRWMVLRQRLIQAAELDRQFATLKHDLGQRATFDKYAAETYRPEALIHTGDRDPADIVLRRTQALLTDLQKRSATPRLRTFEANLTRLQHAAATTPITATPARRALFDDACALRRELAFANPLLDFDQLVFIKRHRAIYEHMCDQFYGICANPGGGLYVLSNAFGANPQVRDVLAAATVGNGRLKGQTLAGGPVVPPRLAYNGTGTLTGGPAEGGSFLSPSLSYDARQLLFAYVECQGEMTHRAHTDPTRGHWDESRCYHIFKVNLNGTDLQQITDGTWNDFDPCWLPNGRVAFISERRGGYLRCGRVCPLYNLYDMAADGSDINCLSFHESNEWNPSVTHDGRIVYTRWDYVDRHGCTAHAPWITRLDGTDSRGLHGNFAPRQSRPDMELSVRAIPGSSKFTATAAPHHGQAFGSLVMVDPRVADDDGMGPVKRITPDVGFPESQGGRQVYGTPWPLSEDYYLCVYDDTMIGTAAKKHGGGDYGIYLVDSFGNKELIYRDPDIGCLSPIPLRPTPKPMVAVSTLAANEPIRKAISPGAPGEATMAVINVYDSLKAWPESTKIKALRVFQLLPMSVPSGSPPHQTGKRLTEAGDSVVPARWVLGTVPVEADGSACFTVPAYREVFFQALDERGLAVQSMRSATYAREGEQLLCMGCHEHKSRALTPPAEMPLALRRAPSRPQPDVDGSNPFSYPRLVQPVLDRNCVACHAEKKTLNLAKEPIQNKWYASYNSLIKYGFTSYGNGYRTTPGKFGARASKLLELLDKGHYAVKLSEEELHRIALWLDCASLFYGVFEQAPGEAQLRGEIVRATLE